MTAKTILSPLILILPVLWFVSICFLYKTKSSPKRLNKFFIAVYFLALTSLTILSFPIVSFWLGKTLLLPTSPDKKNVKAVVILGAGFFSGETAQNDRLVYDSMMRVMRGVRYWKDSHIQWLVVCGRARGDHPERLGELMRDLAVQFGAPPKQIILETRSKNTREHPIFLMDMNIFQSSDRLAIVTSPWHLTRAVTEFQRYFPSIIPVSAYRFSKKNIMEIRSWIPQAGALASSRDYLHEYIGLAWYYLLNIIQGRRVPGKI